MNTDGSWGKKNILLDIKGRRGKARFHELLATADVLIDGQRPGSLAKMGLDDAGLRAINPNLVHASLSCFPIGTRWGERPGFEQIAQAVSGTMHVLSEGMAAPTVVPALINDYLTAIGVVAALAEREQRGGFYHVGAALAEGGGIATPNSALSCRKGLAGRGKPALHRRVARCRPCIRPAGVLPAG